MFFIYYSTDSSRDVSKNEIFYRCNRLFWDQEKSENADIHGSSIDLRLDQLTGVFFLTESNVLTGQGYGYQYFIQSKDPYIEKVMFGFESIVLNKILEQGLIGLVLYFIFLYYFGVLRSVTLKEKNTGYYLVL